MNEPDNFLTRWARRKSEAEAPPTVEAPDAAKGAPREIEEVSTAAPQPTATAQPEVEAEPGFDLASLPSIESISESTDIRGFLRSGVPADLTRTALRRAWASDPAIRNFIGIAENQWDFNDPNAIPGFGLLRETDDVQALLAQSLGRMDKVAEAIPGLVIPAQPKLAAVTAPPHDLPEPIRDATHSKASAPGSANAPMAGLAQTSVDTADVDKVRVDKAAVDKAGVSAKAETANADNPPARHQHGGALPR